MKFENRHPTPRLSLLLLLAISTSLALAAPANDPDFKETCFRELVETYGLEGLDRPEQVGLKMCSNVKRTCCQIKDQQTIFTSWVHGGEEATVAEHYARNTKVYTELINQLSLVSDFAVQVKGVIVKKISNCKLLAGRMLNYELPQVKKKIIENIGTSKKFFSKVFNGFYCAICNHENHRFFKKSANTIIFSEKFCRDIVEQNLPNLIAFHVDTIKLLNLTTKFVTACDLKGDYNLEATFPKELVFIQAKDIVSTLRDCRDNRNKKEWFSYCKDICMNYKINKFSKYFEPNIEEIDRYNKFLKKTLDTIAAERALHPLLSGGAGSGPGASASGAPPKPTRVLAETADKKKNDFVYQPGLSVKVILDSFKNAFSPEGLSMLDEAEGANITEGMFNSIKTELQLARDGGSSQALAGLTEIEQQQAKKQGKRELKSVGLMRGVGLVVLILGLGWF